MPFVNLARHPHVPRIIMLALICGCLLLLGWLLAWADRGFVFSDEAFYLLNAKAPTSYNLVQTQFGYLLQPFYTLTGGDVAAVRRIFILLSAGAGILVGWIWSRNALLESRIPLIAVAGASGLAYYFYWVFTPSYNLLIFISGLLLIGAIGALYTSRALPLTGIIVGVAAVVSALAKIPSAALFALIVGGAIVLLSRAIGPALLAIGAITLAIIGAAAALLPVSRIIEQLTAYMTFFGPSSPLGRGVFEDLVEFLFSLRGGHLVLGGGGILALSVLSLRPISARTDRTLRACVALYAVASIILALRQKNAELFGLDVANLASTAAMMAILVCRDFRLGISFFLMLLFPWAAGFGTGVYLPVSVATFHGGQFAIVAAIAIYFATPKAPLIRAAGFVIVLCYPVFAVQYAINNPYRVFTPVVEQTQLVPINSAGARLRLDPAAALFVQKLRNIARNEGFCEGEPMIDLSGLSPGIAYVMGALPPGFAWLPAGYRFSDNFASFVLGSVARDVIDRSWLVVPVGKPAFPETVNRLGLAEPEGRYRKVGEIMTTPQGDVFELFAPNARVPCRS
ncbi:hypothetical protein WHZ77_10495 [Bradyrhizobium sp. A5]|uniref:hypothetical protein n=1 Tax=Bradyrhizobium sp. A5 TaxID=3133696 RepID=UPI00324FC81D